MFCCNIIELFFKRELIEVKTIPEIVYIHTMSVNFPFTLLLKQSFLQLISTQRTCISGGFTWKAEEVSHSCINEQPL